MATLQESRHYVTQSHSSNTTSGHNLDNNLDALLDDLQTSVARPGTGTSVALQNGTTAINGGSRVPLPPGATGYREVTTTVTKETNGVPMTSRDYQIEYLNPANSETILHERAVSPVLDLLNNPNYVGKNQSYRTEKYEYKVSSNTDGVKSTYDQNTYVPAIESTEQRTYYNDSDRNVYHPKHDSKSTYQYSKNEAYENKNLNKNLNELDVLLKELNAQKNSVGNTSTPNPPRRTEHVSRSVETRVERNTSASPARHYIDKPSSPVQQRRSTSASRELTYNNETYPRPARASSPGVHPGGVPHIPQRTVNVQREVNTIESKSHVSRRDSPSNRDRSAELSPTLRRRTPSPSGGDFRPANFSGYPISPKDTQTTRTVVNRSYNYSNSNSNTMRRTPTPTSFDDSLPYRSPSPVSFPQKRSPSPVRKSLNRSDSGRTLTYQVSPQLSDPNSPTVITYKYSSHSSQHNRYPGSGPGYPGPGGYEEREPLMPRPFPTPSPIPGGEQHPPKKLDDLMASFNDGSNTMYRTEHYSQHQTDSSRHPVDLQRSPSFERNIRPSNVKATQVYSAQNQHHESMPAPAPTPAPVERPVTKSVAGPPVYYPPGVQLFAKKEEEMMEQQSAEGKGKMKAKGKMKYKYEKSEKSKEKSSSGVTAVPVCLPLCCAMPCSIM